MKYQKNIKNPIRFLSLTSVNISLFNEILPFFTNAHDEYFRWHNIKGKRICRRRRHVIQSNSPLGSVEERLFFVLCYLKNNFTQHIGGEMFGMSQQQCGQWLHTLIEILRIALDDAGVLPASTVKMFKELLDERGGNKVIHELIHDGTEREIPRPKDPEKQKEYYSGKKKKHTIKNAVICTETTEILYASPTMEGKMHDKKIADTYYGFPHKTILMQDSGYQGYTPENTTIVQPKKKPKGKALTEAEKAANTEISRKRIRVEHAIGGVKILRIVKDECRLRKNNFVLNIFHIAVGLHNLRIRALA